MISWRSVTRADVLVRWLLFAGILYTVADSTRYFFFEDTSAGEVAGSSMAPAVGEVPLRRASVDLIRSRNLFGVHDETSGLVTSVPASPQATDLALVLQGVFVADRSAASVAIVALPNRRGERFSIGERLPGNAELVAVQSDHVVISNAGVREILRFPTTSSAASRTSSPGVLDEGTAMLIQMEPTIDREPVAHVDDHPDRWEPGFSSVLGMVPDGVPDGLDGG
ncbi:MAG: type II secretion system protein N [Pseudomonadales bacterium]